MVLCIMFMDEKQDGNAIEINSAHKDDKQKL